MRLASKTIPEELFQSVTSEEEGPSALSELDAYTYARTELRREHYPKPVMRKLDVYMPLGMTAGIFLGAIAGGVAITLGASAEAMIGVVFSLVILGALAGGVKGLTTDLAAAKKQAKDQAVSAVVLATALDILKTSIHERYRLLLNQADLRHLVLNEEANVILDTGELVRLRLSVAGDSLRLMKTADEFGI